MSGCTFYGHSGTALQLLGGGLNAVVSVINSTFIGNSASTGAAIALSSGSTTASTAWVTNCTITQNSTFSGGQPAAIWLQSGSGTNSIYFCNTIISGNTSGGVPSDITATLSTKVLVAGSYNLLGAGNGLTNGVNNNKVGINNPQLASAGNYGGSTLVMPPLSGSPVVDAGGPVPFATDQRGLPRLLGLATDIGAVEGVYNATPAGSTNQITLLTNGTVQISFNNTGDTSYTLFATTNLLLPISGWSNIGSFVESPAGHFQFIDPLATNYPARYYYVRSP